MPTNNKKDGLIMQAGILASAGIIVRIIGLLYTSPMAAIIGDEGLGYYNTAYYAYSIILLISSYSIPSAISKVIAQRLAVKEYRNAHRIFKCAMIYVLVVGGIASLFVFFGARFLVKSPNSIPALQVLAPTIFLSGILGVVRGYFQAHKTMMQTSFSQIIEQILNAGFSIGMAYVLVQIFSEKDTTTQLSYGAAGGAIGTGVGVLSGLLFMAGVYALNKKMMHRRIERDHHKDETYKQIFKLILLVVTPFILSTCIYNVTTFLDNTIYQGIMMDRKGIAETVVAANSGILSKAVKISNIPIALASAMATALIPGISSDFSQGLTGGARGKVSKAVKVTMLISIPAAVGMGVLARPVMRIIYPRPAETINLAAGLLAALAASVVFYALSTLSNAVLQSIGKLNAPVINALIALLIQSTALVLMLLFLDEKYGLYYYAGVTVLYALLMCILNQISIRKHLKYKQEMDKTFVRPIFAAIVMGVVAFGVYKGMYLLCHVNIVSFVLAAGIGAAVYFILIIRWKAVSEEELIGMPKGYMLVNLAKKTGILKSMKTKKTKMSFRKK